MLHERVFKELKDELAMYDVQSVADLAGVHFTTLYNWLEGKTKSPHLRTFCSVANALDMTVALERTASRLRVVG